MLDKLKIRASREFTFFSSFQIKCALYLLYVLTAIGLFFAWLSWPSFCLIIFFIIAAIHFRQDWPGLITNGNKLLMAIVIIAAPSVFHAELLAAYFSMLFVSNVIAESLVEVMHWLAVLSWLFLLFLLIKNKQGVLTLWLFILSLAAFLLSPIWFFVSYFCAVHGVLHTVQIKTTSGLNWLAIGKALLLPMFGTVLLFFGFIYFLPISDIGEQLFQLIFIGLFALTGPHLMLTMIYDATFTGKST